MTRHAPFFSALLSLPLVVIASARALEICSLPNSLRDLDSGAVSEHSLITSTRFMRHLWVSDDGGALSRAGLLATAQHGRHEPIGIWLHTATWSSMDPAWEETIQIDSNYRLVSDGLLDSEWALHMVVSGTFEADFTEGVKYYKLTYDPPLGEWRIDAPAAVFASGAGRATIARELGEADPRLWSAFTADNGIDDVRIKVQYSTDDGLTWSSSGQAFGSSNSEHRKSAKILAFADKIGLVYQDDDGVADRSKWFAFRDNSDDPLAPWTIAPIATMDAPYSAINSMHLHWSIAASSDGKLHFVYQDEGDGFGSRYALGETVGDSLAWTIAANGEGPGEFPVNSATYPQVSIDANGRPYVFLDQAYTVWATMLVNGSWVEPRAVSEKEDTICDNKRVNTPDRFCEMLPFAYQVYDCDAGLTSLDYGVAIGCCDGCCE